MLTFQKIRLDTDHPAKFGTIELILAWSEIRDGLDRLFVPEMQGFDSDTLGKRGVPPAMTYSSKRVHSRSKITGNWYRQMSFEGYPLAKRNLP